MPLITPPATKSESIAILCLAGVGDTLMAMPALHALRSAKPQARLVAVTMLTGSRDILHGLPCLDEVIHFDFQRAGIVQSLRFILGLRRRRFNAVIVTYPSNRLEYNVIQALLGAKKSIGHRYRHRDLRCANFLKNTAVMEDDALSNIEENRRLVEALTGADATLAPPAITLSEVHRSFATAWLEERQLIGKRIIGLHPGCDTRKNHAQRRWPTAQFADLCSRLAARPETVVLVFGGPEEASLKHSVVDGLGARVLAVDTPSLLDTCALIERCMHFISNDSGLMHLAGALGVPTTAIFGPTNPVWLRNPWSVRAEVSLGLDCQPCFYYSPKHLTCKYGDFRCIRTLSADRVHAAVAGSLQDQ